MSPTSEVDTSQRKRKFSTKVRTGCITCKVRRVKCDETKPSCVRCTSTGRKCDGYSQVPKTVSFEISTDPLEKWAFHYFRERTTSQVNSFSEFHLWDRLVLQASYSSEVVRRMAIALGAYHEAADSGILDRSLSQQQFAMNQYHLAISRFVPQLVRMPTENILLASIVLAFFENVRGNMDAAVNHLYAGLAIMVERRKAQKASSKSTDLIEKELAPILQSLHVSAATSMPFFDQTKAEVDLPEEFEDLKQAHTTFYATVQSISEKLDAVFQQNPREDYSKPLQSMARGTLDAWRIVFEKFKSRQPYHICPHGASWEAHFELGIGHLETQFLSSSIRLDSALNGSEMTFDYHHAEFKRIVSICQNMVTILQNETVSDEELTKCIGFFTTYVATLVFVAMRCRDPTIRRDAIGTLRSFKRLEAEWNSFFIAEICKFIMNIEESRANKQPPSSADDIPSTARFQFLSAGFFAFNAQTKTFRITYNFQNPDLVKIRMLRSSNDTQGPRLHYENHWLDRRQTKLPRVPEDVPYPEDIAGLFPQVKNTSQPTNLWSHFKVDEKPVDSLPRAILNQIFTPPVDPREPEYRARRDLDNALERRKRLTGQYLYYAKT